MVKYIFVSLRPVQWLKNLFLFAGLIFSFSFTQFHSILLSVFGFLIFCLASSSIYLINDIIDRRIDRIHPQKRSRPIASGTLGVVPATVISIVLAVLSLSLSLLINRQFFFTCLLYIFLMILYSVGLKRIIILDVIIVSFGYIMRAVAGAYAIDVIISPWLILTTFLLALFIALCKRRHELTLLKEDAVEHRKTLSHYTEYLLDQMIAVVTASTVVAYSLYTMAKETIEKFNSHLISLTIPFVIYGIFRYLYLVHRRERGGSPEKTLLTDVPLLVDIILWGISSVLIIYFSKGF
jgi:4-hydroxybenzoate polyprenyltransferase